MTVQAARIGKVKVCATDGSYNEMPCTAIKPGNGWKTPVMADATLMGDTASRMASSGFYDASLSVTVLRDPADSTGQEVVLANNPCWVQYSENGTTYKKCQMAWTCDESHQAGSGLLQFTFNFTPAGGLAPATV
jgi:hypothetical protein